jgi:hypothetical protein
MSLNLPKTLSFKEKLILLKWRDPIIFFTEVTGDKPFNYQEKVLRDITNLSIDKMLICSAGNTGKTRLLASIALWSATILSYMILRKPYSVIIESGSLEQSKTLYDYLKVWLEKNSILSKLVKGDPLKTNTEFTNGSFIKALPASWKSVFGQHCYSKDTQILTEDGWKYFYELKKEDKICTLNPDTFEIEYHKPYQIITHERKGWMIRIHNSYIDLFTTPQHRHFIKSMNKGWHLRRVEDLPKRYWLKRNGIWKGIRKEYFVLKDIKRKDKRRKEKYRIIKGKKFPMNLFLEFLGYYLSEGSCSSYGRIQIAQSSIKNKDKKEKIIQCIKKMGYSPHISEDRIRFSDLRLAMFLKTLGTSSEKYIPKEFKILEPSQLIILINSLMLGDGDKNAYITSSPRLKDDFEELLLKCGLAFVEKKIPEHYQYFPKNKKTYKVKDYWEIRIQNFLLEIYSNRGNNNQSYPLQKERKYYHDKVYCVDVPNHIVYVKRNGKACWSGNSNLLIIDEAVEAGNDLIEDSLRVVATSNPKRRILSSTPHEYSSLFVTMWEKKNQYKDWKRYSWSALECPLYSQESIEEAKRKGNMYFEIFFLGKPYPLKGTMIDPDKLKKCTRGNPIFQYTKDYGYVVMGIDWGWYPDPTAIVIVQRNEEEIRVLFYDQRKKEDPEHLIDRIYNLCKQYKVERIFSDSHNKHMNALVRNKGLPLYEVSFKGEKNLLQSNLTTLIEREILKIPEEYIPLIWQIRQYTYNTKGNDDLVDALMLACKEYRERKESTFYFKVTKPNKRKRFKSILHGNVV